MKNNFKQYDEAFYGHPKPLSSLFLSELWERFSIYGIRPLLILYMSAMVIHGGLGLDRPTAAAIVGLFSGSMYLITIFGGWIADNWLGQARSVWYGSIIIALGHLSIALTVWLDHFFFYFGLVLIVLGTGLFKTCISVMVGTLYNAQDSRRDAGFSLFYMGINIGAFLAPLATGLLAENYGWHLGFGIGGIGMLISLIIFRCIAIPQIEKFNELRNITSTWKNPVKNNQKAPKIVITFLTVLTIIITLVTLGIVKIDPTIIVIYLSILICIIVLLYFLYLLFFSQLNVTEKKQLITCFILLIVSALFWSAFEQQPTSFNLFAQDFTHRYMFGFEIPTVWFQSINSLFIIILAPIFAWLWIKLGRKGKDPHYITKFIIALFFAAIGFALMILASQSVLSNEGALVSPLWLVFTLLFLTLGELCLSPVGLSAMTKLAPKVIRGQIMGLWFTSIALGSLIASLIGGHVSIENIQDLPSIFMSSTLVLLITAIILWLIKKPILKMISTNNDSSNIHT